MLCIIYVIYSGFHLCLQSYLVPKCGLLRRLCTDSEESDSVTIELNDIPGGADAFELCAKFCYGITINLCAHNLVNALCASKFLRMSDSVDKGNLFPKLESFFHSCVLQGWKDSIITLQSTAKLPEWCENLGIIRKCIDSIVEKILTPTAEVCQLLSPGDVVEHVFRSPCFHYAGLLVSYIHQTRLPKKTAPLCSKRLVDGGHIRP